MSVLLTPPAVEPLSLGEVKQFLRVEHDDDDTLIEALIAGARIHVEAQTRSALIAQTWRLVLDAWPRSKIIPVLPAPLRTLLAARVYLDGDTAQTVAIGDFGIDRVSQPGVLIVPAGMPTPTRASGGIEIDVELGYGAAPGDVPEPLRQAIRLLVAYWYENRSLPVARGAVMPADIAALLAPYRVVSL
jgi:uncharacterized phiE125 gp8 family phage protein